MLYNDYRNFTENSIVKETTTYFENFLHTLYVCGCACVPMFVCAYICGACICVCACVGMCVSDTRGPRIKRAYC